MELGPNSIDFESPVGRMSGEKYAPGKDSLVRLRVRLTQRRSQQEFYWFLKTLASIGLAIGIQCSISNQSTKARVPGRPPIQQGSTSPFLLYPKGLKKNAK
jgi:hypothetical protein